MVALLHKNAVFGLFYNINAKIFHVGLQVRNLETMLIIISRKIKLY